VAEQPQPDYLRVESSIEPGEIMAELSRGLEALLASRELTFSSHGAVHGAFGKEFVMSGELDAKFHHWLLAAFGEWQETTYDSIPSSGRVVV
jgi:hypothetical protein